METVEVEMRVEILVVGGWYEYEYEKGHETRHDNRLQYRIESKETMR